MSTEFNGDNKKLIESINALLALDAKGALAPHGIGEFARVLLQACEARLPERNYPSEAELTASGLGYPIGKEDAVKLHYAGYRSEVITVLEAWEAIGHDIHINPDKQELMESLRNMAAICAAHGFDMPAEQHQGEPAALAIPEECPHLIVFDDTEVASLMFSGAGARAAALKKWEAISTSWNAHLFVRVARNSRDDGHPCANSADSGEVERLREEVGGLDKVLKLHAEALKGLIFAARTTGGTAGPDHGLMHACEKAEHALSLGGIGKAYMDGADAALSASAEPSAPRCGTCNDHGLVGNIIDTVNCPDCAPVDAGLMDRHEAWVAGVAQGKAEASAPVERDERAEFDAAYERGDFYVEEQRSEFKYQDYRRHQAWAVWKVRAAQGRKP